MYRCSIYTHMYALVICANVCKYGSVIGQKMRHTRFRGVSLFVDLFMKLSFSLDEGGFHQFLQRHPALELSKHHVYVKCKSVKVL